MAVTTQQRRPQGKDCVSDEKWALVLNDSRFPMPRAVVSEELVREQACVPDGYLLVRDHNSPHDPVIRRGADIDLREGNVFKLVKESDAVLDDNCQSPAKLAWFLSDAWEITVKPKQAGGSLRRLHDVPENLDLFRDRESPCDDLICGDDELEFADGPVFDTRPVEVTIKINKQDVVFTIREPQVSTIKETAKAQGVSVEPDFVLYQKLEDGSFSPAIHDDRRVCLMEGMAFRCVATDDNS